MCVCVCGSIKKNLKSVGRFCGSVCGDRGREAQCLPGTKVCVYQTLATRDKAGTGAHRGRGAYQLFPCVFVRGQQQRMCVESLHSLRNYPRPASQLSASHTMDYSGMTHSDMCAQISSWTHNSSSRRGPSYTPTSPIHHTTHARI